MEETSQQAGETPGQDPSARPDFTTGPLLGLVVKLALPSMLAMLFHSTYHFFDMIWLGRVGKEAIAAVTAYMFFWMLLAIFNQLVAMGSLTLIARSYGAKNYEETSEIIGQTFIFKILFAVPASVIGYFFLYDAFIWYGANETVAELGQQYGRIMLLAMPIYFSGFTLNTGFRSIGDVWKPLILASISMTLNIALDPLFIFGVGNWEGFGVRGAAYASVLSQSVFFVTGLYIFLAGKTYVKLSPKHLLRPKLSWIVRFIKIGGPAVVGDACRSSAQFTIGKLVFAFGTATQAAFGIGGQLFMLAWIPLFGIDSAVSTLVGQNLGAAKPERAEKTALRGTFLSVGIMALLMFAAYAFAPRFVGIFNGDPAVVHTGTQLIRFAALALMFVSISAGLGAAFWGSGDTIPYAVIAGVTLWGVQIPLAVLFVKLLNLNVEYIWFSTLLGEFTAAVLMILWFSRGKWKRKKV